MIYYCYQSFYFILPIALLTVFQSSFYLYAEKRSSLCNFIDVESSTNQTAAGGSQGPHGWAFFAVVAFSEAYVQPAYVCTDMLDLSDPL